MQTQSSVVETTRDAHTQLEFIDGLRAVSALLVVLHHAFLFTGHTGDAEAAMPAAGKLFEHLNEAVPVFIVLSGFVLLPRGMNLKGKLGRYIYRRSRRILPPYYAALALFALLIAVVPALHQQHGTAWDDKIPVTATSTMAHVFMVHNLSLSTAYTFDGPMWSVATEYQIYFLLPLVLLPLWRKFNRWVMLTATVAFALAIPVAAPALNQAHLWFVALFAFGLVARSLVNERTIPRWAPVAASVLWIVAIGCMLIPAMKLVITDLAVGAASAASVAVLADRERSGRPSRGLSFFGSPALVRVGLFSYSIYLVNVWTLRLQIATEARFAMMLIIAAPIAIATSYLFYRAVERRVLTSHQQKAGA
jgi:peptidoglycan/LPS O-acetylase OafA/YrhL